MIIVRRDINGNVVQVMNGDITIPPGEVGWQEVSIMPTNVVSQPEPPRTITITELVSKLRSLGVNV